jgi:gliding motility-associated-like protein
MKAKMNLLSCGLLFIATSAIAQNTPHDLKQKSINTLSSSVSKEQLQKEAAFFGADSLAGFNLSSAIDEALPHYSTYSELKSRLYFLEANYVKTKFGVALFPWEMDNKSYSPTPPEVMSACSNVDFESGSFAGWTGKKGYNTLSTNPLTVTATGIFTTGLNANYRDCSYHTLVNTGTDYYGGFPMLNPGGGSYSVRLGGENANVYDGTDCVGPYVCHSPAPGPATYCGGESLEQTFTVGATNTLFTFSYAAVLNDGGHTPGHQPYFSIQVFNNAGVAIGCFSQRVELVSGVVPPGGVLSANGNCWFPSTMTDYKVYYIPWKTNSYNLSAYVGQNVTVKFTASGCTEGDHFCYAYFDASCGPAQINTSNASPCTGSTVTLTAPATISGPYAWTGPGIVGSTTGPSVVVNSGGTYSVTVGSGPCSYSLSLPVTFAGSGTVSATATSPAICAGTSTAINASAASTYNWSANAGSATTGSVSVSPASTTTYTVSGTSTGGCPYSTTVTVNVNALPTASASSPGTLTCTTLTTPVTGSSSTGTATYNWAGPGVVSGGASATATVNTAGTYTVTVTDPATSCSNVSTVTVNSNTTQPGISPGPALALNCSTTSGTITAGSGTGGATYSWAGPGIVSGGGTAGPTVNAAGTYTVTVTNPANGCTNTATVNVTSTSGTTPNVTVGPLLTLSCSTTSGIIGASSGTGGVTYSWSGPGIVSGAGTSGPTVNAPGTYTVTVTDPATGCTNTATSIVANNAAPPNATPGAPFTLTCTALSGTVSASSSTPGVTYNWSGPGITAGGTTASASVNAAGVYTAIITDPSNGCATTATVNVTSNTAQPDVTPGGSPALNCSITSGNVTASSTVGTVTYNWTGAGITSGGSAATATVNAAGTYTVTVTDPSNGCTNTANVTVTSNTTAPDVTPGSAQTITCSISAPTISASSSTAGATYNWSGAGITAGGTTSSPTVNAAGTYTVTVTDPANSCTATATVDVLNSGALPDVSTGTGLNLDCITTSGTIAASSTTPGAIYSWTGSGIVSGGSAATATVNAAGTYTVTVTDPSTGCNSNATVVVNNNTTLPDASPGSALTLNCSSSSGTIHVTSATTGATFNWSGAGIVSGGTTAAPVVNAAGTYTVTVTDPANGCTDTATVPVADNTTPPDAVAGSPLTIDCTTTSGTISVTSVTPGATYNWTGAGIVSGGAASSATVNAAGTYTVTVTDPATTCTATATVIVTNTGALPNVTAGSSLTLTCVVNSGSISASSTTAGVTYSWTGAGIVSGGTTASPTVDSSGTYSVIVTDPSNGCTNTTNVSVTTNTAIPDAIAGAGPALDCLAPSGTVNVSSVTPGAIYTWSGAGIVSGGATSSATVNAAGTYTVIVTDPANGCTGSATVNVTNNTVQPDVSAGAGLTLDCTTASGVITASSATPGVVYSWSGPGIVSGGTTAAPVVNTTGMYTVTVTDPANGCVNITTVNVGSNGTAPTITSGASNDSITCADPASVLGVTSGSSNSVYSWSGPGGFTSGAQNPNISVPGDYIVTVVDTTNGCSSIDTVTVVQGADPVAGFTSSVVSGDAPLVVDFTNTSSAGFSGYSWTFGDLNTSSQTNPENTYTAPGTYVVTLIGLNGGCSDTVTAIIDVKPLSSIFIPNVFTPDDDGINDLFTVSAEGYKEIRFVIYDRWGLKLWEMSAANSIWWNGRTTAGVPCSDGTYYYILYGEDHAGKKLEQPGFLTLLRGGR